jgi:flagellar biosynthesis/type III secretory pathway protein FliH
VGVPRIRPGKSVESEPKEGERAATAAYVASLAADLAALARKQKLDTLGYLLDLARLEAEGLAQGLAEGLAQGSGGG